jgi:hypothetical protein
MNNFMNKISHYLGQKNMSHYPELYDKKNYTTDLSYTIAVASTAVIYETHNVPDSINWKLI